MNLNIFSFLIFTIFALKSSCSSQTYLNFKEEKSSYRIGVFIKELGGEVLYSYRENEKFPFMSTIKTVVAGHVLNTLSLKSEAQIPSNKSLVSWSPETKKYVGNFKTIQWLVESMLKFSDNTATNILIEKSGGLDKVNDFLSQLEDSETRLDRLEPHLNNYRKDDARDTTTPKAMAITYEKIIFGKFLSKSNKNFLLKTLRNNQVSNSLLRSFIPPDYQIADRSGAGGSGSRGIVAIIFPLNRKPIIISVYLTESKLSIKDRDILINSVIKNVFRNIGYELEG